MKRFLQPRILLSLLSLLFLGVTALVIALLPENTPVSSDKPLSSLIEGGEMPPLSALISTAPSSSISSYDSPFSGNLSESDTQNPESSSVPFSSFPSSVGSSLSSAKPSTSETVTAKPKSTLKGVWVSYLELKPILQGKNKEEFSASFDEMMAFAADCGLDSVFLQVRPFADAIYPSEYFPMSHIVSGTRGQKIDWDPLAVMLSIAKKYNLAVHAWINPYRITSDTASFEIPVDDPIAERSDVAAVGSGLYLLPSSDEAVDLIAKGVRELLTNYPTLAGIHMDDYFYPTTDASFDAADYKAYQTAGGKQSLSLWRMEQVTLLCKRLYAETHKEKNKLFGISPAGNMESLTEKHFVDVRTLSQETDALDYICPQIYFGYENATQPFATVLAKWETLFAKSKVQLWVGLPFYKVGAEDVWAGEGKDEFLTPGSLSRMTADLLKSENVNGLLYYSLSSMMNPNDVARIELANCKGRLRADK